MSSGFSDAVLERFWQAVLDPVQGASAHAVARALESQWLVDLLAD
jgi:hypothetical protein